MDLIQLVKSVYSTGLFIFSITIVCGLIFNEQTKVSSEVHPVVALVVMITALVWLNMVERGQGSLVGLPPVDRDLYVESHPTSHHCTSLAHKGDNLDRYLMVFTINQCDAPPPPPPLADARVFGFPDIIIQIFLGSGAAMILMTAQAGQLNSQVNASLCMLDYINNFFAVFTLYVALAIEFSGLLHSCYLVQMFFVWASGKEIESKEPPRDGAQNLFYWGRILISLAILCYAMAVTLVALFDGKTTMWAGVTNGVAVILFFLFMSIVGMLEGMQIAFFAVAKLPKEDCEDHPMARKTCELLFRGDGRNLPGFMIGRQIFVTMCFFIIACVTTLDVEVGTGENIFGVSDSTQEFFNTGLLGALITTIIASIAWQLVVSIFPIAFLSSPIVHIFLEFSLLLEATGIFSGACVLASVHKAVSGFQLDEVYIGTPEERVVGMKPDHKSNRNLHLGTNVLVNEASSTAVPKEYLELQKALAAQNESYPVRRERILSNIKSLREEINACSNEEDAVVFESALRMETAAMNELNQDEENEGSEADADEEMGMQKYALCALRGNQSAPYQYTKASTHASRCQRYLGDAS